MYSIVDLFCFFFFFSFFVFGFADSGRAVQEYLLADVHAFAGEREFHDDITLVVLFVPNQ